MKPNLHSLAFLIRLFILTALISVLGFALASPYANKEFFTDDTARARIAELEEISGDLDPPQYDEGDYNATAVFDYGLLLSILTFSLLILFRSKRILRPLFLPHIRPRSPPL